MIVDHLLHVVIALAVGLAVPLAVSLVESGTGRRVRLRVGVGGRVHSVRVPRQGSTLPAPLARFAREILGDVQGPVKNTLGLQAASAGLPGLRWRLFYAGWGDRSILWYRGQQALAAVAALLLGVVIIDLLRMPWPALLVAMPPAALVAHGGPTTMLSGRIAQRQERLRRQLVPFLYGMAAFLAAGHGVEQALDLLASRPGELSGAVRDARAWQLRSAYALVDAIDRSIALCGTPEVRDALLLIMAARDDVLRRDQVPRRLTEYADLVRAGLRERRKIAMTRAALRATALGTILALPIVGTAVLYPALSQALRTLGV